jgi:hypothetical protein
LAAGDLYRTYWRGHPYPLENEEAKVEQVEKVEQVVAKEEIVEEQEEISS